LSFQVDPSGFGLVDELCTSCISNPGTNPSSGNFGCLLSGELNSTWFTVNVAAGGTLEFSFGAPGGGNCYDWIMWPYDANTCDDILANAAPPNACNWNSPCNSFTGMASTPPVGGDATNFEPTINVNTGDQYLILFSNYSSALTSVPMNFFGTADISCTVLPVELNDFSGVEHAGYNELKWSTSSEVNSSRFEVEKSSNGVDFIQFASIDAAGTDLDGADYKTYDYSLVEPTTYYRLKYINLNLEYKYSDVIAITRGDAQKFTILSAYPNPASDVFTIEMVAPHTGEVYTEILDLSGKSLYVAKASLELGAQSLDVPVKGLAAGSYFVVVSNVVDGTSSIIRLSIK
jgi:hypothetical protein